MSLVAINAQFEGENEIRGVLERRRFENNYQNATIGGVPGTKTQDGLQKLCSVVYQKYMERNQAMRSDRRARNGNDLRDMLPKRTGH